MVSTKVDDSVEIKASKGNFTVSFIDGGEDSAVYITQNYGNGDYASVIVGPQAATQRIGIFYARKDHGELTLLSHSDPEGIPTKKITGPRGAVKSFTRKSIEWVELKETPKS